MYDSTNNTQQDARATHVAFGTGHILGLTWCWCRTSGTAARGHGLRSGTGTSPLSGSTERSPENHIRSLNHRLFRGDTLETGLVQRSVVSSLQWRLHVLQGEYRLCLLQYRVLCGRGSWGAQSRGSPWRYGVIGQQMLRGFTAIHGTSFL